MSAISSVLSHMKTDNANRLADLENLRIKAFKWKQKWFIKIDKIKMATVVDFRSHMKTDNANRLTDLYLCIPGFKGILKKKKIEKKLSPDDGHLDYRSFWLSVILKI